MKNHRNWFAVLPAFFIILLGLAGCSVHTEEPKEEPNLFAGKVFYGSSYFDVEDFAPGIVLDELDEDTKTSLSSYASYYDVCKLDVKTKSSVSVTLYRENEDGSDYTFETSYTVSGGKASIKFEEGIITTSVISDGKFSAAFDGENYSFSETEGKKITDELLKEIEEILTPKESENPDIPENPDTPDTPENPDTPETPAEPDPDSVVITFNANDGSENPAEKTQIVKKSTYVTLDANTFTRDGFTFAGWATSKDAYKKDYKDSYSHFYTNENKTLYAVWFDSSKYTFVYHPNYEGAQDSEIKEEVLIDSTDSSYILKSNTFVREGWRFMGWAMYSSGSVSIKDGGTISSSSANGYQNDNVIDFYAVWVSLSDGLTITFKANGGVGEDYAQKVPVSETGDITAFLAENTFTYDGYCFYGWNTYASTSSYYNIEYVDGEKISLDGNLTLYAIWLPSSNAAKITYDDNFVKDGNEQSEKKVQYLYANSSNLYNKILPYYKTRENYEFLGWSESSTAISATYTEESYISYSSKLTTDTILYAVWKYTGPVTITFDGNGGTVSDGSTSVTQIIDNGVSTPLNENTFVRDGFTFMGWATSKNSTYVYYNDKDSVNATNHLTIYAVWKENPSVVLNVNGGSGSNKTYMKVPYNSSITFPTQEELGWTNGTKKLLGFASSSSSSTASYKPGNSIKITADSTYYAVWIEPVSLSISVSLPAVSSYDDIVLTYDEPAHSIKAEKDYVYEYCWYVNGVEVEGVTGNSFNIYMLESGIHTVTAGCIYGGNVFSQTAVVNVTWE